MGAKVGRHAAIIDTVISRKTQVCTSVSYSVSEQFSAVSKPEREISRNEPLVEVKGREWRAPQKRNFHQCQKYIKVKVQSSCQTSSVRIV